MRRLPCAIFTKGFSVPLLLPLAFVARTSSAQARTASPADSGQIAETLRAWFQDCSLLSAPGGRYRRANSF